ncbi:hypothetical protein MBLNU230_g4114t1 [Neophaeotheca triangularis]
MASIISSTAYNPILTGGLLFALTRAPDDIRLPLIRKLQELLSATTTSHAITALKWLFGLSLAKRLSNALSDLAQNNFHLFADSRYHWPNEIVLVTGAAGGFGSLFINDLSAKGLIVVGTDIVDSPAWKTGPRRHYYQCDITDREAVMAMAERIRNDVGDPSILINNAGIAYNHSLLQVKEPSLRKIFDVNLFSHYYTLQAFLPAMIAKNKGHVVNIASMASFTTTPSLIPYSNTKVAALGLHEGLRSELRTIYDAPLVKTSVVHPFFASTPMTAKFASDIKSSGAIMLDPQVVSDAVVQQILSGWGKQIVLGGGFDFMSAARGWPHWLSGLMGRIAEGTSKPAIRSAETANR